MEILTLVWPVALGLLLLIAANIALGSCDAWIAGKFDVFLVIPPGGGHPLQSYLIGASDDLSVPGYTRLSDSPDIMAVVGKVADVISNATIHLMRNTPKGDIREKNALSQFMDISPWRLGTRKTLISWLVSYMLATDGNSFLLPQTSGGMLVSLNPMPGAYPIAVDCGDGYAVNWRGRSFDPDEVLHFVFRPSLYEPWRGTGVRLQLKDVLKNLKQAAATTNGFMSSQWKPSVIVKVDALADEFSSPAGRKLLVDDYLSGQRAGEPWVIPADLMEVVQVKPLSLADLAISDGVQLDRRSVAAALGVPPYLVGVGAYNQDEYNNFVRTMIGPLAVGIQQELTRKLLISPELYFRFNDRKLYAYTLKELAGVADDQYVRGIMSGNEVRDWISLPPVAGLDERVILENYIPAGMIGEQKKLKEET
ncbi:MAG: phage portal protein [Oscillospiraceae bacterium]